MGRKSHQRALDLWMNGEHVGTWRMTGNREELQYASAWHASPQGRPISLSLPLLPGNRPHRGPEVDAYFDNLLPDSLPIRKRIAQRFGVTSAQAFDLLEQVGRDCVGALQLMPEGQPPGDVRVINASALREKDVEAQLESALTPQHGNFGLSADEASDAFRFSLAGAQEKTALLHYEGRWMLPHGATPTTHILKLPLGTVGPLKLDMHDSVENEWLCLKILRAYELPVTNCQIEQFGRFKVLVVERFDRAWSADWLIRLPQEDFCQVTGTPPEQKYEAEHGPGMKEILSKLLGSINANTDRRNFLKAQLLFWLLAAPDGHAKNFSVRIEAQGRFSLTPLYDVLSAYPLIGKGEGQLDNQKIKLAMAVRGKNKHWYMNEIARRHWNSMAKSYGLGEDFEDVIGEVIERTPKVVDDVRRQLTVDFPNQVSQPIFQGLTAAVARLAAMPTKLPA